MCTRSHSLSLQPLFYCYLCSACAVCLICKACISSALQHYTSYYRKLVQLSACNAMKRNGFSTAFQRFHHLPASPSISLFSSLNRASASPLARSSGPGGESLSSCQRKLLAYVCVHKFTYSVSARARVRPVRSA